MRRSRSPASAAFHAAYGAARARRLPWLCRRRAVRAAMLAGAAPWRAVVLAADAMSAVRLALST